MDDDVQSDYTANKIRNQIPVILLNNYLEKHYANEAEAMKSSIINEILIQCFLIPSQFASPTRKLIFFLCSDRHALLISTESKSQKLNVMCLLEPMYSGWMRSGGCLVLNFAIVLGFMNEIWCF